jgi:hypothetical protein
LRIPYSSWDIPNKNSPRPKIKLIGDNSYSL